MTGDTNLLRLPPRLLWFFRCLAVDVSLFPASLYVIRYGRWPLKTWRKPRKFKADKFA